MKLGHVEDPQNIDGTKALLDRLVAFPTVSNDGNAELINYVTSHLSERRIEFKLFPNERGDKASILARIGPDVTGGILLSGHTDVVPVIGQQWTTDPFKLERRGDRLYGRGAADMKGFIACAIAAMVEGSAKKLRRPLYLALSYDEEIGCVGVRPMLAALKVANLDPACVIVGEPTQMEVAVGHKGKLAAKAICCGHASHSALAPLGLNAIHLASDFLSSLRELQRELEDGGAHDAAYEVPFSTVHAGIIAGGTALNIVPDRCVLDFEIRNLAEDDPKFLFDKLFAHAERISASSKRYFPDASVKLSIENEYPGLNSVLTADVGRILGTSLETLSRKVAYGTEGGLYSAALNCPVAIVGPGSMKQGHRPDEYIEEDQLRKCQIFLQRIISDLAS